MKDYRERLGRWLDQPQRAGWTFLAPALVFLGIFVVLPMVYLLYLSLTTGHFTLKGVRWVGLAQYARLFTPRLLAGVWQYGDFYCGGSSPQCNPAVGIGGSVGSGTGGTGYFAIALFFTSGDLHGGSGFGLALAVSNQRLGQSVAQFEHPLAQ